jgi:alpha-L-rhamnosidase
MKDVVAETKAGGGIVPLVVPNAMKDGPWPAVPQAIWDDVIILLPWTLYRNFGDLRVLRDSWDGMKEYLENIRRGDDGLWSPDLWQLGDWLDPNAPPSDPGLSRTDGVLVADEYLVHVTSVMVKIATALNLASDVERLQAEHDKLKQAFLDKYVAKSGLIVGDSQTSLALQIVFGLHHDAEQRKVAAERLVRLVKYAQFRVSTGFAGTPTILRALSLGGHDQVAYRMLLEEGCPSWLYPVLKGATTNWERWDSMLEDGSINPGEMTSFNHYALGSVAEWLHETVGGIKLLEPGWKKFLVKPSPGGDITHADTTFHSPCGTIQCSWKLVGEDVLEGTLTVPPNATAVIETPDGRLHVGSGVHGLHWNVKYSEAWPPKALLAQFREP